MFRNYLKIAIRNIVRHKAFSMINIAGLTIGMTCSIFIFLWVRNELSYDRFHQNSDQLFRVVCTVGQFKAAVTPYPVAQELQAKAPGVKRIIRFTSSNPIVFQVEDKRFEEPHGYYVDSTFLQAFSFRLVKGDRSTALSRTDGILITESMAKKYFGSENPIGKMLRKDKNANVLVTGVLADIPSNSHLQFDYIMPFSAIAQSNSDIKNYVWDNFNFYSYVQLEDNIAASDAAILKVTQQADELYKKQIPEELLKVDFALQPLSQIHLHSDYQADVSGHGSYLYVKIFFIVAIFILVVACINFMNLSTARSARRAKEVGLRKVVGAVRGQLIGQFLGESIMISFMSLLLAILLVWLLLPAFNLLAGKELGISLFDVKLLLTLIGIALVTGLVAGSYPALFLSGFRPVKVLKGNVRKMGGNLAFRNTLVVLQFVVSIVLLAGTVVVFKQMRFIKNMNLGFERSNLLYMPIAGDLANMQDALRGELKSNTLTSNFTITNAVPANHTSGTINVQWEGKEPGNQTIFPNMNVNEDFFRVFRMKMASGREFSSNFKGDSSNYIINETAARAMNMTPESAVGKPLEMWGTKGMIVGVVKDFNFKTLQHKIDPMILRFQPGHLAIVRTQPGQAEATIKAMEKINTKLNPAYPFSYGFVDQEIDKAYKGDHQMGSLFNVFAILAILISCMGLYGLSAFMAEQRTKEIGVRKVLGASVGKLVYLLSLSFTRLILIATLIAIPLAWWAVNNWLEGFAYRTSVSWVIFALSALAALIIAWLTVGYESIKAAIANPVKSLRSE
ncbi:ABC transporter permease [Terrimonas sp. NA20]|uniref:ABC transporter permease n=1 Tax=Terrimonas ginsenosidimutans TaxID=2908004 RepID=A0ABS9KXK3_9BACT|nr:ABC transporter permease [Terrimonas ginsenosidimutans]MCG2617076.1 ABC transporter permease [Terrimonas ginsenosidimutans]